MNFTLLVSRNCNCACKYCFEKTYDKNVSKEVVKKLISRMKEINSRHLSFFGGEPLVNWEVIPYAFECAEEIGLDLKYGLITNGVLLDAEKLDFIKKHGVSLAISFDGQKRNEKRILKSGKPALNAALKAIKLTLKAGIDVEICPVICKDAVVGFADDMIKLYKQGVKRIAPAINDKDCVWTDEDFELLKKEYSRVLDFVFKMRKKKKPVVFSDFNNLFLLGLDPKICPKNTCDFGTDNFVVDVNGDVYPCVQFIDSPENVVGSLDLGIDFEKLKTAVNRYMRPLFDDCKSCAYNWYCHFECPCRNYIKGLNYCLEANCKYIKMKLELLNEYKKIHNI